MPTVYSKRKGSVQPPADAVLVDRTTKFGNPHPIGYCKRCKTTHDRAEAIAAFACDVADGTIMLTDSDLEELRGRDLVCWCAPLACHADVLLRLANKE